MRIILAKSGDVTHENGKNKLSVLPIFKLFRVRPVDIEIQDNKYIVSIFDLSNSNSNIWKAKHTDQLKEEIQEIGKEVKDIKIEKTEYGVDLIIELE